MESKDIIKKYLDMKFKQLYLDLLEGCNKRVFTIDQLERTININPRCGLDKISYNSDGTLNASCLGQNLQNENSVRVYYDLPMDAPALDFLSSHNLGTAAQDTFIDRAGIEWVCYPDEILCWTTKVETENKYTWIGFIEYLHNVCVIEKIKEDIKTSENTIFPIAELEYYENGKWCSPERTISLLLDKKYEKSAMVISELCRKPCYFGLNDKILIKYPIDSEFYVVKNNHWVAVRHKSCPTTKKYKSFRFKQQYSFLDFGMQNFRFADYQRFELLEPETFVLNNGEEIITSTVHKEC